MKRFVAILAMWSLMSWSAVAQIGEVGIGVGTSNFLGDLGKKSSNFKSYFGDIDGSLFRPAVQVYYRHSFSYRFAGKVSLSYGVLEGDDRLSRTKQFRDDAWYRSYRNLSFKSFILEAAVTAEFNILKYAPGSMKYRWTPYVFGGVGLFAFDPKTEYNGEWVRLQPLGTEGQGLPNYPERRKYALVQPSLPLGLGIKFNINKAWSIGLEMGHRITFTDYLDDVSSNYVSYNDFSSYYGSERAIMAYELSRRSTELDPEGKYGSITKPGEVRGNPKSNDSYLFTVVSVSYNFSKLNRREHNPFAKKNNGKYRRVFR
ncbi:hypothetical protein BH09BAC1_BH09BAC1_30420 [soil metagenome]